MRRRPVQGDALRGSAPKAGHPALILEGVSKRYGRFTALSGIDFQIEPGEIVALVGANGAGKTTLMSIAAGLSRPDCGGVWVDGIDMLAKPVDGRGHLGIATQETGVYPTLSVRDNLRFFGELAGLKREMLDLRLERVARTFGLFELLERQARLLSVGEVRRLHTATAVLRRVPLLLLDEPTTGVDVGTRARMLDLVRVLAAEGSAICYSTHYLEEAEQLGASVAVLHEGRIVARDSLQSLIGTHGQSAIELRFDGPPPRLEGMPDAQTSGATLRILTDGEPAREVARLLSTLGDSVARLRDVRLIRPDLASVVLSLTGQQSFRPSHHGLEEARGAIWP